MRLVVALLLLFVSARLPAESVVVKRALVRGAGTQRVANPGLEQREGALARGWQGWELGYQVDRAVRRGGQQSARCQNGSDQEHRGICCVVELNQQAPAPLVAECWSKAEGVSGSPDADYSLYLDLEYSDGTPLWGLHAPFRTGTHDWERRTVTVFPPKPVRRVHVYGLLRRHAGTAWFDDFSLRTFPVPPGTQQFDGVPVAPAPRVARRPGPTLLAQGLVLRFDGARGDLVTDRPGGVFLRDAAARSDFVQPCAPLRRQRDGSLCRQAREDKLQLALTTSYRALGQAIRIDGEVRDLAGRERAVTVYFTYPVDAIGWRWPDDQRSSRLIRAGEHYDNLVNVGVGATGMASRYPLACVSGPHQALALGVPLDMPRLCRLGYDAACRELYAAFDLGLSPGTVRHPGRATFSLVLYPCDPGWGFRSALARYYRLFPHCFTKRNRQEGIWMPFTDLATVPGCQDFGFAFKEGNDNVAFDEQQGVYSFVYVEPMSLWVTMPPQMARTNQRALAYVQELAAAGKPEAQAALCSTVADAYGQWVGGTVKCPWCDGAIYHLNPSPCLRPPPGGITQFALKWQGIAAAFERASGQHPSWPNWDGGYLLAPGEGRAGTGIRLSRQAVDRAMGASQVVVLNQQQPLPLVARVWSRAQEVSGEPDANYSLYVDARYADGTPGWSLIVIPARTGSHGWELLEATVTPPQPVKLLTFHLLLRPPHAGTAWFDQAFLGQGADPQNLLADGEFEPRATLRPELDGVYMDSFEMGSLIANYQPQHLAQGDLPLTFDGQGRPCQLLYFHTLEFARELAWRLHPQGKLTFANGTPWSFPWGAAWLDVMGTETNWAPEGAYTPDGDAVMNYRRALCYQRPYLLLLNTVYDQFPYPWVERYLKRCAAYGIFPSMFSHNAADDPYWQRPALYERDRPLFRRYIPLIKALSAAGWEPVTLARSDNAHIYLERFGRPGGPLYLTVFNDSPGPQRARIHLDRQALWPRGAPRLTELLSGTAGAGGEGQPAAVQLGPEDLQVWRLH